ncbi:hypothetical protein C0J52_06994 [Blattella germanica]|nr:hypothetical protein C0J52_06994 [Blattella germanica]
MAALASVSDYAATYMTGNIREKLWVNTMCMKHLRFSHELIRARNQYISALNKLGPKPEPTKNETKMTEKEELQRKKMLEHVEDLRMTAQFENSLKDLKQLRKAWIFLLEHFQQFEDIINGKPVELDPETEDKLSKEMDYWIDYFKRRGRLGALIKRHKRNIRKAKIAKKLPKPKKVIKRKRKSKPKNQLFVQKCKKSIKRWTATKYPKPPTEQELDDELKVLDLEREDWINVDPYMESDEPFSPAAYLRNYVIKCRKMGRFANLNAFDSLKPKPSTSQPAKKRSRRLKIELDTDSDDADSNQTAISSEQGTSIFKKPRPPLAPSPHKKVKKPCDSDDPHNNESARSSEQSTSTFKKPPRPALAPSPHKKVKKPHESDDADNNQSAISSEQVTSTFKKPPPRPPLAPSPHKKKVKDGYLHYIHPMKWNLISIDKVRKAMNNGGQFDMKKATYTPLLKDSIDNSIESLLPSPLQKIKLRMELKENPISKGRQILKHPLWIPQFVPDLVIQKIENLTSEELEYYKKPGEPHWQGPKVDFFQFLCDMIQIIADQRWTVTCNGILFGVTHLVKVIVSHTEIKEERCEVLTKLIKELLLCRPSINVLTELLVLLYRLGHVKTIQENLCIGAGPDPYLQGRFGLVHFHKGLPRMDMCHKQEDVYYFYRRHKEDKLFPDLKDFLGTAVRFIKKQAYLDNDTGLLMTNREGQYQEVVRGLWENVDEIDFGIDERKALKILNDLEDQVDGNPPELEMTDEGEEIMGTITNKIMSFLKKKSIENTREIMSKKRHSLKMTPKVHR